MKMKLYNINLFAFIICYSSAIMLFFLDGNYFFIFLNLFFAIINLIIHISLTKNND